MNRPSSPTDTAPSRDLARYRSLRARAADAIAVRDFRRAASHLRTAVDVARKIGRDPTTDLEQLISLWEASGDRRRAEKAVREALTNGWIRDADGRARIRYRLAELLESAGRDRDARAVLTRTIPGMARSSPLYTAAVLLKARSELADRYDADASRTLVVLRRGIPSGEWERYAASYWLLTGAASSWTGDELGALTHFARAADAAEVARQPAPLFVAQLRRARAERRLGLLSDSFETLAHAEREARRRLLDPARTQFEIERARTAAAEIHYLERDGEQGSASGLRGETQRHLAQAIQRARSYGQQVQLADLYLCQGELRASAGKTAAAKNSLGRADSLYRRTGLARERALCQRSRLQLRSRKLSWHEWRRLARHTESNGWDDLATLAWLEVSHATDSARRPDAWLRSWAAASAALAGHEPLWPYDEVTEALRTSATALAAAAAREAPEPRPEAVAWVWRARLDPTPPLSRSSGGRTAAVALRAATRERMWLEASHRSRARRSGRARHSASEGAVDRRVRARATRASARYREQLLPTKSPPVRRGEALVTYAVLEGTVHVWIQRDGRQPAFHCEVGSRDSWWEDVERLRRHDTDALDWPDGVVPETLGRATCEAMEQMGERIWSPLLPALQGISTVLVCPEPQLPLLPFAAISLVAPPRLAPRPTSLSLLPDVTRRRPRAWRIPRGKVWGLSLPELGLPAREREARGAVRVLGGEHGSTTHFSNSSDLAGDVRRPLRQARAWHLAAPLWIHPEQLAFSAIDFGHTQLPFVRLLERGISLDLAVFSGGPRLPASSDTLGRIVGEIGPMGARTPQSESGPSRSSPADVVRFHRLLLHNGIARLVTETDPRAAELSAIFLGGFYAGLARGDTPAQALYLAQRNALREDLHPAHWAGFTAWGWP